MAVVVYIVACDVTTSLARDDVALDVWVSNSEEMEPPKIFGLMLFRCVAVVDPPSAFDTAKRTVDAAGIK